LSKDPHAPIPEVLQAGFIQQHPRKNWSSSAMMATCPRGAVLVRRISATVATAKPVASFHDFDAYEALVKAKAALDCARS